MTVGVPVYEHEEYVSDCLLSVAEQEYPRIELVVIDDGSSDDSAAVVRRILDAHGGRFERVEFRSRPNRGLLATLTEIVELSTGEVIIPIASDDALCPGSIRRRVELLATRPDMLAVITDCAVIDEHGDVRTRSGIADVHGGRPDALLYEPGLAVSLMLSWCIPGPCVALRRAAFDPEVGVGPYSGLCFPEDFDLYLRLTSRRAAWFVHEPLAQYRMHSTNISQTRPDLMQTGNREALGRLAPRLSVPHRAVARTIIVASEDSGVRRQAARIALRALRSLWFPVVAALGRRSRAREEGSNS